ncbi:hypothetical protein G6F24_017755 [Rhizopus arrhizus]|nr:hypothetical protein G6F24_017755 [Rhizopus arrhizus]
MRLRQRLEPIAAKRFMTTVTAASALGHCAILDAVGGPPPAFLPCPDALHAGLDPDAHPACRHGPAPDAALAQRGATAAGRRGGRGSAGRAALQRRRLRGNDGHPV